MSDSLRGNHRQIGVKGFKKQGVGRAALTHDDEEIRIELACRNGDREVVDVVVRASDQTHRIFNAGIDQWVGFGTLTEDTLVVIGVGGPRIDNADVVMQTQAVQLLDDGAAEMAIPADDPFARGGLVGFGKGGAGYPGQAFHKLVAGRAAHGQCQALCIQCVGIHHKIGAERIHVGGSGRVFGSGDDRNARVEQADVHGDGEVGVVTIRNGKDGFAVRVAQTSE